MKVSLVRGDYNGKPELLIESESYTEDLALWKFRDETKGRELGESLVVKEFTGVE